MSEQEQERHATDEFNETDEPDVEGHIQDLVEERKLEDTANERELEDTANERERHI